MRQNSQQNKNHESKTAYTFSIPYDQRSNYKLLELQSTDTNGNLRCARLENSDQCRNRYMETDKLS